MTNRIGRSLSAEERQYLDHLRTFDGWNTCAFLAILACFGLPPSYLDIGCGTGIMVRTARRLNIDAVGLDLLVEADPNLSHMLQLDVGKPFDLKRQFGLITCIEVAEHVPEPNIDQFIHNVALHAMETGMLILSAAGPGQGGENHTFLRPGYWWRDALYKHGFSYRSDYTTRLRLMWHAIPSPLHWLPANVQVFDR